MDKDAQNDLVIGTLDTGAASNESARSLVVPEDYPLGPLSSNDISSIARRADEQAGGILDRVSRSDFLAIISSAQECIVNLTPRSSEPGPTTVELAKATRNIATALSLCARSQPENNSPAQTASIQKVVGAVEQPQSLLKKKRDKNVPSTSKAVSQQRAQAAKKLPGPAATPRVAPPKPTFRTQTASAFRRDLKQLRSFRKPAQSDGPVNLTFGLTDAQAETLVDFVRDVIPEQDLRAARSVTINEGGIPFVAALVEITGRYPVEPPFPVDVRMREAYNFLRGWGSAPEMSGYLSQMRQMAATRLLPHPTVPVREAVLTFIPSEGDDAIRPGALYEQSQDLARRVVEEEFRNTYPSLPPPSEMALRNNTSPADVRMNRIIFRVSAPDVIIQFAMEVLSASPSEQGQMTLNLRLGDKGTLTKIRSRALHRQILWIPPPSVKSVPVAGGETYPPAVDPVPEPVGKALKKKLPVAGKAKKSRGSLKGAVSASGRQRATKAATVSRGDRSAKEDNLPPKRAARGRLAASTRGRGSGQSTSGSRPRGQSSTGRGSQPSDRGQRGRGRGQTGSVSKRGNFPTS